MNKILDFYKISAPSSQKVEPSKVKKTYKQLRFQAFIAATFGYSLYYVCRTSLNVVKSPIIDSGILNASQLGTIGLCLFWAYAIGKFVNGFLSDHCNITRFMATGLIISSTANLILGLTSLLPFSAVAINAIIFTMFAIMWGINGWAQSMGAPPAIISLTRWYPLSIRGTFYGFFSASHNFGEFLSFLFVGIVVTAMGWQWGFYGAAVAGALGVVLILLWLHDNPESKGLPPIEILSEEKTPEQYAQEKVDNHENTISMVNPEKMMSPMNDYAAMSRNMFVLNK